MAAVLKYWREAATTIVVCRTRTTSVPKFLAGEISHPRKPKTWFDYKVLMLKRSEKIRYMPSAYVFPGGVASDADFSAEWLGLFGRSGVDLSEWQKTWSSTYDRGSRSNICQMLTRQRDPEFSAIPADVAFRICAIRETFEESGLLLVRKAGSLKLDEAVKNHSLKLPVTSCLCWKPTERNLVYWRNKVEKDAFQFIRLCQTYNFLPDIWSLYDWSNWLTPTIIKHGRFDTAFYLTVLDEMPQFIKHDSGETADVQWMWPDDILRNRYNRREIAAPQILEVSRLAQLSTAKDVVDFAAKRSEYGMKRCLPVRILTQDGVLEILPGDFLYPEKPDLDGIEEQPTRAETIEELNSRFSPKFRMHIKTNFDYTIYIDIDFSPEHLSPLNDEELAVLDSQSSSKL